MQTCENSVAEEVQFYQYMGNMYDHLYADRYIQNDIFLVLKEKDQFFLVVKDVI